MPTPHERWDEVFLSGKSFALINDLFLDRVLLKIKKNTTSEGQLSALDVGCGTGDLLKRLVDRGFAVDGVDASAVALEEARHRLGEQARKLLCVDLDRDGLKGTLDHYDLVTMKLVLAFISDKGAILDEVKAKIVPDGAFLLITPIINDTMTLITPKAQAISIPEHEVEELLDKHFASWELLNTEETHEGLVVGSYLGWGCLTN